MYDTIGKSNFEGKLKVHENVPPLRVHENVAALRSACSCMPKRNALFHPHPLPEEFTAVSMLTIIFHSSRVVYN